MQKSCVAENGVNSNVFREFSSRVKVKEKLCRIYY